MYFKDQAHLKMISPIMLEALKLPKEPRETIGTYRALLIKTMCRELEKLVLIHKSRAAHEAALAAGITGDLSSYNWAKRKALEVGGAKNFHFEHTETVYELCRSLDELTNPTLEEIERILARARVTWVTERENSDLDKIAKKKRPDWRWAYKEAGIDILEP